MNALPSSGSPAACVRGAGRRGPRPIGFCAGIAAKSVARPSAQDARRPRRLVCHTVMPRSVLMPSDLQESADLRGFSTDSLGINHVSSLAAEDAHQTVLCTREGPGPDLWRRVDRKDFQFLGRAGMEVHFGGLGVCVAEPDRDLPDCQWRSKKGPPWRCKQGPLGGCGLVP